MTKLIIGLAAVAAMGSAFALDLGKNQKVTVSVAGGETAQYAGAELARLLGRAGVTATVKNVESPVEAVAIGAIRKTDVSTVRHDGFVKNCAADGVTIASTSGKGVLNGVYTLAEEMGFAFLMPGEDGERVPVQLKAVEDEIKTVNPRFQKRGLFSSSKNVRYSNEEWYAFLAKLRFNSICAHSNRMVPERCDLLRKWGFAIEAGGHGMSACLPRKLFDEEPELFRMFQPEDFGGKRMKDSNFCVSNPKTRRIVKENFIKRIQPALDEKIHAVHAWADDLPGGGWCMCSRCRALLSTDQSQLTMNVEAQAIREIGSSLRVPVIAYHDTMFPSTMFAPDPICFLLFAPRERCYAHALNDKSCAKNRIYHNALKAYQERFKGVDDAHTFEYYNDKLLFRGHTPYMPDVILGDADAYEEGGITCWMSLQVGGDLVAADWNMLAHSLVAWEYDLDAAELTHRLALKADEKDPAAWERYLTQVASAYETGWQVCDFPYEVYMDYRFMPERGGAVGAKCVADLEYGAKAFREAVDEFGRVKLAGFAEKARQAELARAAFEAIDFDAMVLHQRGLKNVADYLAGNDEVARKGALDNLNAAAAKLDEALAEFQKLNKVEKHGQYYEGFVKNWTKPEILNKVRVYAQ